MMHVFAWRPAVLATLVPALALSAAPAFAQQAATGVEVHSMVVGYGDLDLASRTGRNELERRVRHSAEAVCGYDRADHGGFSNAGARDCYDTAVAHAHISLAAVLRTSRMASSR